MEKNNKSLTFVGVECGEKRGEAASKIIFTAWNGNITVLTGIYYILVKEN